MKKETILEVIENLVGRIAPLAESHTDSKRLENLKVMTYLIEQLVISVIHVSQEKDSQFNSVKTAGEYAHKALLGLLEELEEYGIERNHD